MRHQVAGRKLGRTSSHRIAMLRNMATSLFRHERIETTLQKAKTLRPFAEKLITLAKKETLHARRQVLRDIHDREIVSKLFSDIGVRFATRPGGYTRIIKTVFRRGDNADMAIIELVGEDIVKKPKKRKAASKKKAAPATAEQVEQEVIEEGEAEEVEAAPAEEAEAQPAEETAEAAPAAEENVEEPAETPEPVVEAAPAKEAKAEEPKAEAAPAEQAKEEAAEKPAAEGDEKKE